MEYIGYIYLISNDVNDKIYIGQTTQTIEQRFYHHKKDSLKKNIKSVLYYAFNKYGIKHFTIKEIKKIIKNNKKDLKEDLNLLEQKYIREFNTLAPNGYNLTIGGDSFGNVRCIEVIQVDLDGKIINSYESIMEASRQTGFSSGQICDTISGKNKTTKGYYWFNKNDIKTNLGYVDLCHINSKIVAKYDLDGNLICTYDSLKEASIIDNLSPSGIAGCCLNYRSLCGNFRWVYYNRTDIIKDNIGKLLDKHSKKVIQFSLNKDILNIYNSIKEASKSTGIMENGICSCCKGVYKTSGGFIWEYA